MTLFVGISPGGKSCAADDAVMFWLFYPQKADFSKLPLITSSYYLQSIENRMIINIDSIPTCKKVMREKGFAYSATQWVFETFFAPDGDWQLLGKETSKIEYTVIMNIPSHLKRIATDKFIPVLQELFTLRMEEA